MRAHELAKVLLEGPDEPVYFAYNYGDHWRTEVAGDITEVEQGVVEYSDYHSMMKTADTEDKGYDSDNAKYKKAVVLR